MYPYFKFNPIDLNNITLFLSLDINRPFKGFRSSPEVLKSGWENKNNKITINGFLINSLENLVDYQSKINNFYNHIDFGF